jgi:hypothetical protein
MDPIFPYTSVLNVFLPWMFRIYSPATYFENLYTVVPPQIRHLPPKATLLSGQISDAMR